MRLDLLGVVQARPADDRAGQLDGLQVGHRRDRPGLADLHTDARHAGCGLVLLELVGDHPPRGLRCGPEAVALVVTVHLEHQPVDLEIQLVQPLDEPLAMVGGRLEAGEACRAGRGGDAVVGHFLEELHVRLRGESLPVADGVTKEPQSPLGADPRVQLADAAGNHVPRVGKQRLALGLLPFVEQHQVAVGHVNLAPWLQQAGVFLAAETFGDVVDRADVVRHVVACAAVAAGDAAGEQTVFVDQRHGHAVHLQLDDPFDRLASQQPGGPAPNAFSSSRL